MSTQAIILIGVGVYVAIMLAVGIYSSKKTHSMAEFAVAGRSMPLWLCTTTIVATWFGGGMMIGGAAIGSFIAANSLGDIKGAAKGLVKTFKGPKWKNPSISMKLLLINQEVFQCH